MDVISFELSMPTCGSIGSTPSLAQALPCPLLLHALLDPSQSRPVTRFILSHFFFLAFTFACRLPFVDTTCLIAPPDLLYHSILPRPLVLVA